MTLSEIRTMVETITDNEFDTDEAFVVSLNLVLMKINMRCSTTFEMLDLDEDKVQALVESANTFTFDTGVPSYGLQLLVAGLARQILEIEQEDDRLEYKVEFEQAMTNFLMRLPAESTHRSKTSTTSTEIDIDWED
jgi:hypothetical protein